MMTTYKQKAPTHKTDETRPAYRSDAERAIIQNVASKHLAILVVIRAAILKAAR